MWNVQTKAVPVIIGKVEPSQNRSEKLKKVRSREITSHVPRIITTVSLQHYISYKHGLCQVCNFKYSI
jgi:hypothetical protein